MIRPAASTSPAVLPRVLFVDQTGQLGGAELSLLDLARGYRGACAVALLADGPFRERLEAAGVETHILPLSRSAAGVGRAAGPLRVASAGPAALGVVRRLARLARGFDTLYANTQKAWVLGAGAALLAGKPSVWHLRDILTADHFSTANRRVAVTLANRRAQHVICNSQATADAFVAAGGHAKLTRVVYNGIDPTRFGVHAAEPTARSSTATWQRLGLPIPESAPVAAVFGRLSAWKGQHVAIEALRHAPDLHLVIVGEALFGEDNYAAQLRHRAADPALAGRVHLTGFCDDVPALMHAADVVVHCSTSPEPFGRVVVEAMLCGRPVIASDAGGTAEIVRDGDTGLLVKPDDPAALSAALRRLLAAPDRTAQMARAGQHDAAQRFSLETAVRGVEDVLRPSC